jgi:hypothetical protein
LEVDANSLRYDLKKLLQQQSPNWGLLFCLLPHRVFGNWVKMGTWVCCAASFFCADSHLSRREIKQRELGDVINTAATFGRGLIVFFPDKASNPGSAENQICPNA